GVGIDTSRYGHVAAFLCDDLQPAADELSFPESAQGYASLRQRLERIAGRPGLVHLLVRLHAPRQYAHHLLHLLHRLAPAPRRPVPCGAPPQKSTPPPALFEAQNCAPAAPPPPPRSPPPNPPTPPPPLPAALRVRRQVAGRLQAVVRQRTRLINQFHHLLA